MAANGTISGTPTVSGTFNYTVTDYRLGRQHRHGELLGDRDSASGCYVLYGNLGRSRSGVQQSCDDRGRRNCALYVLGCHWHAPRRPDAESITGAITGTPTAAGTFTIQVKDANGVVATGTCPFTIVPAADRDMLDNQLRRSRRGVQQPGDVGSGRCCALHVRRCYRYASRGPDAQHFDGRDHWYADCGGTFTVQVTDANGVVATGTCPFTIVPAPTVTCSTTNSGEVGVAFNSPAMTVTGGVAPYTFSIATGTLPGGLTLNASTGAITGTPTAAGTFTIKVTDANGAVATGTCPFTIVPPPTVTCPTINSGEVGLAFNSPAPDRHRRCLALHVLDAPAHCPPA